MKIKTCYKAICVAALAAATVFVGVAAPLAIRAQVSRNEGLDASVNPWRDDATGKTYQSRAQAETNAQLDRFQKSLQQQQLQMNQLMLQYAAQQIILAEIGKRKIQAGKATTAFVPAAESLAPAQFVQNITDAAEKAELLAAYNRALADFRRLAAAQRLAPNDLAAAFGLAFAVNFEIYSNGQKPSAAQRAGITESFRRGLLADAAFQGWKEADKQILYESKIIKTMLAKQMYDQGASEKDQSKIERAREIAAATLDGWWNKPVEGLELTADGFGDRGERLVRENKATTRFEFAAAPIQPRLLAEKKYFSPGLFSDVPKEEQLRQHIAAWEKYYTECLAEFKDELKKRNRAINDLAEMGALAVSLNYEVYAGQELTARQYDGVAAWMRDQQLTSQAWQSANDRTKQMSYEYYAINAVAAHSEYRQTQREIAEAKNASGYDKIFADMQIRNSLNYLKERAKRNLVELFTPLKFDELTLTEAGFEAKKAIR